MEVRQELRQELRQDLPVDGLLHQLWAKCAAEAS
jgi:hypothetical protein